MTASVRAAGWHPDETDAALLRYWDGSGWTPHTTARSAAHSEALQRTVRLASAPSDHTTVPVPPPDGIRVARAGAALANGGTITAAAALLVATAALAVALLG
ncbi:DUF2510 domain-containing protein [Agromyces arachidis]|uniref:DUF2510 domain-containing protein n=1 Tax=Agromyces arachidis TaxID=766966 RepID=UPI0040565E0D